MLTRVGKPYLFKALQPFRQTSEKCITVAEAYSRRDEASHVATQVGGCTVHAQSCSKATRSALAVWHEPASVWHQSPCACLHHCMMG